jgi:heat shock protein HslJ
MTHPSRLPAVAYGIVLLLAAWVLPTGDSFGAAVAVYRGDGPAGGVPGKRHELRLRTDGTMTWIIDHRNNRAPVTEEGRWYPISAEEFDLIIETRDGKPVNPAVVRFEKKGDVLHTTSETADQFGPQGLSLKQSKAPVSAAGAPIPASNASPVGLWQWQAQLASTEPLVVDQPDRYTLDIQAGGKALVRADCNRGSASYKMEGRTILFKLGAFTRAACPSGSHAEHFLKMLESVVSQRARGDTLFLDLPAEAGSLKFVRAR